MGLAIIKVIIGRDEEGNPIYRFDGEPGMEPEYDEEGNLLEKELQYDEEGNIVRDKIYFLITSIHRWYILNCWNKKKREKKLG